MRVIGIMSGTSCDGVDAIMVEFKSVAKPHTPEVLGRKFVPFPTALQSELLRPENLTVQRLCELQFILPNYYSSATKEVQGWESADICGVHGQTLWHQVAGDRPRGTLQIGSSGALAQLLGMPVVGDFRAADVALGGQGAPIAPFAHWFFASEQGPAAVVNFGGMSNVSVITPLAQDVVAYDLGPGMVLSDAYAQMASDGRLSCDEDGVLSCGGRVVPALLNEILGHPFVSRKPPKSTGREDFGHAYFSELLGRYHGQYPVADIARTLVLAPLEILRVTADHYDKRLRSGLQHLILTGGGAKNPILVSEAKRLFPSSDVEVPEDGVLAPSNHEPAAMALIAARTVMGLPSSLPQVTGASRAAILGHIYRPSMADAALTPAA